MGKKGAWAGENEISRRKGKSMHMGEERGKSVGGGASCVNEERGMGERRGDKEPKCQPRNQ